MTPLGNGYIDFGYGEICLGDFLQVAPFAIGQTTQISRFDMDGDGEKDVIVAMCEGNNCKGIVNLWKNMKLSAGFGVIRSEDNYTEV